MNTREITASLHTLFGELIDGPPGGAYMLNRGDIGLLASVDKLSAADASRTHAGGASIAAHVDHLRYGLSLMNRWASGENPWANADWTASWRKTTVSGPAWRRLRDQLRDEIHRWLQTVRTPRDVNDIELIGMAGTVAHLAYHIGAIRQMNGASRGPLASD